MDEQISIIALIISFLSLGMSFYFWRCQFRPIVTVSVRTVSGGNTAIAYALHVMNSGSIPAKDIQIVFNGDSVEQALGQDSTEENKTRWVRSINENPIFLLQNGDTTTCSFGTSQANDQGFWKYGSEIILNLKYKGWFGYTYKETQKIKIQDSESFTGYMWNPNA